MRDLFEQWVETRSERIRSPVLGSLAIAFIVSNWKPLFFLLFAEAPVWLRIRYFEHHTDSNSLVWYPLAAGLVAAFLFPWITLGGAWVARFPKFLLHRLQQTEGTRREIGKLRDEAERIEARTRFEEAEADRQAQMEAEKIAGAERLKRAASISNELEEELLVERERALLGFAHQLPREAAEILQAAASDANHSRISRRQYLGGATISAGSLTIESRETGERAWQRYAAAIPTLEEAGLIASVGTSGEIWEVTSRGFELSDFLVRHNK